jgi:hypothetical protein
MDIVTTLSSIKTAYDLAKDLKETKSLMDNADINLKVADLVVALADARIDLAEIKNQMIEKDKEIEELKEHLEKKDSIKFEDPFIFRIINEKKEEIPYCPKCYHSNSNLVPLLSKEGFSKGSHQCSVCESWYGKGLKRSKTIIPRRPSGAW